jgi:hypothetical protein
LSSLALHVVECTLYLVFESHSLRQFIFNSLRCSSVQWRATCLQCCMALNLYRRHRKACEGSHPEDTRTGQFEEGRRGWKKCACLIHVSGTLGGKFSRRQTGTATKQQSPWLRPNRVPAAPASVSHGGRIAHFPSWRKGNSHSASDRTGRAVWLLSSNAVNSDPLGVEYFHGDHRIYSGTGFGGCKSAAACRS